MINLNKLAVRIADIEGGAVNCNIAQIKEILKITLELLKEERADEVIRLIFYRK